MKSTQRVPARLGPYNCYRSRQSTEVESSQCGQLFQSLSRWVRVTFFVLVHVEVRVGHVCCERVVRLLEAQVVHDASSARSRARRKIIVHCFVTLELPRDKTCCDSVLLVVQIPACCHSLLACPQSRSLQILRVVQVPSAWPSSPPQSPNCQQEGSSNSPASSWLSKYPAGSSSSVPNIVTPATVILRTSIREPSHRGCFACGGTSSIVGSAARLVGVVDLSWAFGVTVGNTVTAGTFASHRCLPLTSRICLSLSSDIRVLRNSTELVVMMTTRMNCHLNCLMCLLSGFRGLVVRLVQVLGVSCVSHDAVRLVPGPKALPVSRATMKFLNVSSVPAFRLLSPRLRHSLFRPCARRSSLTYLTRSLCPMAILGVLVPTVSANGTISCV